MYHGGGKLICCEECGFEQSNNGVKKCENCDSSNLAWGVAREEQERDEKARVSFKEALAREQELEAARQNFTESARNLKIDVLTTPSHPTKSVREIYGVISAMQTVNPKALSLKTDEMKLKAAMQEALDQIKVEAAMLGANAVIGLQTHFQVSQRTAGMAGNSFSANTTQVYLVGTAVLVGD